MIQTTILMDSEKKKKFLNSQNIITIQPLKGYSMDRHVIPKKGPLFCFRDRFVEDSHFHRLLESASNMLAI